LGLGFFIVGGAFGFNMKTKKIFFSLGILLMGILFLNFVVGELTYCCEKTTDGAWCQNAELSKCVEGTNPLTNQPFRKVPTSCESTSYCKKGCCYDSLEGTCMENTPQKVCEENKGIWADDSQCEIPQCELGCCLIGEQAAFVSLTRCKRLSGIYGLEINFRKDIANEVQCILASTSEDKGACVFEQEFEKTCKFTTQKDCKTIPGEFYKGYLCSAPTLNTKCGMSEKTTCVDGKDEVYFQDTCGNVANIYDASKIKDQEYWTKIADEKNICDDKNGNVGSAKCGNCDYYLGSTCKTYSSAIDNAKPTYGNNICRNLACEWEGKKYQHGETWCADSEGTDENLPGSRYFRLVCYNSEVTIEPCADFRQERCIQDDINGFKTAACRANMWQECVAIKNQRDCENIDKRDCVWVKGIKLQKDSEGGTCVPKYSPGLDFWNSDSSAEDTCSAANTKCVVTFEKDLMGKEKCVDNCECLESSWKNKMNSICNSLGDCASNVTIVKNYIGVGGYYIPAPKSKGSGNSTK